MRDVSLMKETGYMYGIRFICNRSGTRLSEAWDDKKIKREPSQKCNCNSHCIIL